MQDVVTAPIETKICARCGGEKPLTSFRTTRYKGKLYRRNPCQACASKAWRKRHPAQARINTDRSEAKYRKHNWLRKWKLMVYINQTSCQRCPESDIRVLIFHHRDPATKSFAISWAIGHCYSFERLSHEALKCDVLCSNCHSKEHAGDLSVIMESLEESP